MKNTEKRSFHEVSSEYQESLKELLQASMMLREAVGTLLRLDRLGAAPAKSIANLVKHYERAERAAQGTYN